MTILNIFLGIPIITLVLIGFKNVIYYLRIHSDDYYSYSHLRDLKGVIFYFNLIFRLNIKFRNNLYFHISDILVALISPITFFYICYAIYYSDIPLRLTTIEVIVATIISVLLITNHYFLEYEVESMKEKLRQYEVEKNDIKLIKWLNQYKKSPSFKVIFDNCDEPSFQETYQKWKLHKDLQETVVPQNTKTKRFKRTKI